jgi:hypothetical protein
MEKEESCGFPLFVDRFGLHDKIRKNAREEGHDEA